MINIDDVLDTFKKVSEDYIGNANSIHSLGTNSKKLEEASSKQIKDLLKVNNCHVIYTSSLNESINLLLFGYLNLFTNKNVNILIDNRLDKDIKDALLDLGINVLFFDNISKEELKSDKNILIYFSSLPSNIEDILKYKNKRLKIACDISNDLDKNKYFNYLDFIAFDLEKIKGILGIGALIIKDNITLTPLLHGGKSTTPYRSGTPALALICSFAKNLRLWYNSK